MYACAHEMFLLYTLYACAHEMFLLYTLCVCVCVDDDCFYSIIKQCSTLGVETICSNSAGFNVLVSRKSFFFFAEGKTCEKKITQAVRHNFNLQPSIYI